MRDEQQIHLLSREKKEEYYKEYSILSFLCHAYGHNE